MNRKTSETRRGIDAVLWRGQVGDGELAISSGYANFITLADR